MTTNAETEAGIAALLNLDCEVFHPPAAGKLPTRLTGLGNLNIRLADQVPVTDTGGSFDKAFDDEVLAECAVVGDRIDQGGL